MSLLNKIQSGVDSATKELDAIWDEIGLDKKFRDAELTSLIIKINDNLKNVIEEEKKRRDTYLKDIKESLNSIKEKELFLGTETDIDEEYEQMRQSRKSLATIKKYLENEHEILNKAVKEKLSYFEAELNTIVLISDELGKKSEVLGYLKVEPLNSSSIQLGPIWLNDVRHESLMNFKTISLNLVQEKLEKENEFDKLNSTIDNLSDCLGEDPSYYRHDCIHCCDCDNFEVEFTTHNVIINETIKPLSPDSLETLRHYIEYLSSLKKHRLELISSYESRMKYIVDKLEEPNTSFPSNQKLSLDVLNMYRYQLAELEERKRKAIGGIIEKSRAKLEHLWSELCVSEEEKSDFLKHSEGLNEDELLSLVDQQVERLNESLMKAKPIIDMIKQRVALCESKIKLENPDPKRLLVNNKNSTFLLKEEKLRKKIKTELPILTKKIYTYLKTWEKENNGVPLLYKGENYLLTIAKDIEAEKTKKEELAAKKEQERLKRLGIKIQPENTANKVTTPLKSKTGLMRTPSKGIKTTMSSEGKIVSKKSRLPLRTISETPKPEKRQYRIELNKSVTKSVSKKLI